MRLIRGLANLTPADHGCVATIGNFDGVHLGHRAVFHRLLEIAAMLNLPATVITFEPQPLEFFTPTTAPARLTRLREKATAIAANHISRLLVLEFTPRFAAMRAAEFVTHVLVEQLGIQFLLVGDDFRFGYKREGDFELLNTLGSIHGFAVENLHRVEHGNERISSTRIRNVLAQGEFELAQHLLGRPYSICGRVQHGDKRGRQLGFPTANVYLQRRVSPLRGVYAVQVRNTNDEHWSGVANIGQRPTVGGGLRELLEVHLFDFDGDLYGQHLEVTFRLRLREERHFHSLTELQTQIALDVATACAYLKL